MAFALTYEKEDQIPEDFKGAAKQVDGKFVVNVVPNTKLEEFRDKNIELVKERDGFVAFKSKLKETIGTDDLEAFGKELPDMRSAHQKVKDKTLVEAKGLNEAIEERTKEMKVSFETQLKDSGTKLQNLQERLTSVDLKYKTMMIQNAVNSALMEGKTGLRHDALPVILDRALKIFRVNENEQVVPYQGDTILYGSDGATAMSPTEWLKKLGDELPFLLKDSSGGGGGGKGGNGSGVDTSKMTPSQKMAWGRQQKNQAG